MNQQAIEQLNQFKKLLSFKKTWAFNMFVHLAARFVFLCTGNQYGKTAGAAKQYVDRIFSFHPVPKKNLLYFECPKRADAMEKAMKLDEPYESPHGYYTTKIKGIPTPGWEKGTWNILTKPKDGKCPYCGEDIIIHKRNSRVFRFCSQTLPGDKDTIQGGDGASAEVKNATYPEFKKWLPPFLIKKDITFRSYAMTVKDPWAGHKLLGDEIYQGMDTVVEFVSYSQSIQSTAGTQKCSVWVDEEPPKDFWDEQIPRLFAEDGDIVLSLTPANAMSWTYDELYERAGMYIRTPKVCEALSTEDRPVTECEITEMDQNIAVVQASSYDNPTIGNETIKELMETADDPDVVMTRLYGVHKQSSGRVFKDFDYRTHVIDGEYYFPDGIYRSWRFARMIDYHEKNPWACLFIALSPQNEAFAYEEFSPSPEKLVTRDISMRLASLSADNRFSINIIDPLANKIQSNTGTTVLEDLNAYFREFRNENSYVGFTGGLWEPWDTKSTRGRDEVRRRLKWAKQCKRPFNNKIIENGQAIYVPTLWIFKNCSETAKSLKQWRYEEHRDAKSRVNKDASENVTQKFSHFSMCLEAISKDRRFRPPMNSGPLPKAPNYMKGRAA